MHPSTEKREKFVAYISRRLTHRLIMCLSVPLCRDILGYVHTPVPY